ncbi:hypothetical protein AXX17_AT4G05760 [Arabidopsis thaliana]|uniref:Transmembrane protein n=1 Tax=Arabidopsis thaliana TaxID=3702 RepID=A0A178UWH2_ARATH|nr:hypothetical protein AXX17_AT4G05760 [Arabidopsis thaliana]
MFASSFSSSPMILLTILVMLQQRFTKSLTLVQRFSNFFTMVGDVVLVDNEMMNQTVKLRV